MACYLPCFQIELSQFFCYSSSCLKPFYGLRFATDGLLDIPNIGLSYLYLIRVLVRYISCHSRSKQIRHHPIRFLSSSSPKGHELRFLSISCISIRLLNSPNLVVARASRNASRSGEAIASICSQRGVIFARILSLAASSSDLVSKSLRSPG